MSKKPVAAAAGVDDDASPARRGQLPRISLPLTADKGRLAVDKMQPHVRDRLRQVMQDPELRAKLELEELAPAPAAAAVVDEGWDPEFSGILYDVAGRLMMAVATRYGYSAEQSSVLTFSADDKQKLAAPTAAVLDKYFPGGLAKWGPEVVLAATLLTIVGAKVETLRAMTPANAAPAPAPIPFPTAASSPRPS